MGDNDADQDTDQQTGGGGQGDNPAAARAGIYEKPSDEEIAEIEEERKRRLDPANRPENSEVKNTDPHLSDESDSDETSS